MHSTEDVIEAAAHAWILAMKSKKHKQLPIEPLKDFMGHFMSYLCASLKVPKQEVEQLLHARIEATRTKSQV